MPRESEPRRRRSKSELDPSSDRSRRDGKPTIEKSPSRINAGVGSNGLDQKQPRGLQDALPLGSQPELDFKVEKRDMNKASDKEADRQRERIRSSDVTGVPRSRSHFQQHDERGNAGQDGRSSRRRTAEHGSWRFCKVEQKRDSKDEGRAAPKSADNDVQGRPPKKSTAQRDDNHVRHHDKFFEEQADLLPPAKKRRPFREEKLLTEHGTTERAMVRLPQTDHAAAAAGHEKREEKRGHNPRYADRNEHDHRYRADRLLPARGRDEKTSVAYRGDRYGGGGNGSYRVQDNHGGRHGYNPGGSEVGKWKHDLFQEANRSPTPKNEEDHVAKVEALLAS